MWKLHSFNIWIFNEHDLFQAGINLKLVIWESQGLNGPAWYFQMEDVGVAPFFLQIFRQ